MNPALTDDDFDAAVGIALGLDVLAVGRAARVVEDRRLRPDEEVLPLDEVDDPVRRQRARVEGPVRPLMLARA